MDRLTEIRPGIFVATGNLYVTNSTVVSDGRGGCLVVDPAVTVAEVAGLAADLSSMSLQPQCGFATHPHWDHVLWIPELGDVPRFASALTVAFAERERERLVKGVETSAPGHDLELFGRLTPLEQPGEIQWTGPTASVITHQGHAPGHSAVFLPDSGTLIAGDMCSDIEFPLLDLHQPDPVGDYLAALDLFAALPVDLVVPGHGGLGDGADFRRRIELDRAYLEGLLRGPELRDPRPVADWLIAEHERQVAWFRNATPGGS